MRTPTRSFSNAKRFSAAAVAASVLAIGVFTPCVAKAQVVETVNPTPKGIVGGALLGAELGTIIESIAGVHSPWVYVITDVVLGAGGAIGGWEVEQTSQSDARAPVFMLAGGLGLIIPAVVLTLNATRYRPSENATEDHAPTNVPAANPGTPGGSIVAPAVAPVGPAAPPSPPPPPNAPPGPGSPGPVNPAPSSARPRPEGAPALSLFDVSARGMRMGVPVPEVRPVFSMSEVRQYGLAQQTEVRMPLVKIAF
jgi:hypothetical protein